MIPKTAPPSRPSRRSRLPRLPRLPRFLRLLTALLLPFAFLTLPASAAGAEEDPSAQAVQWLSVDGNQITDEAGRPVTLRGLSVLAPRHNSECAECDPRPIADMIDLSVNAEQGWHNKVLRLPVTEWAPNDSLTLEENFAQNIDPYVQQAIELGIYVIVDFHRVQNYGDDVEGGTPQSVVREFWEYVAPRYADVPNVIFEVYNEPLTPADWATWKSYITPVVDAIRGVAPNNLILMGSPNWSTMVNEAAADPIADANTAYVYHLYPNQGPSSAANLDARFGNAAETIPVVLTEFGWNPVGDFSDAVTAGTTKCWGVGLRNYLDERPWISWNAWVFDNYWKPQMFDHDWNLLGGEHQGQFVQNWLSQLTDHNQPGVDNPPGAGDDLGVPESHSGTVVENGSAGYTDTGDWVTGDTAHGFHGTDYRHDGGPEAAPERSATFTPELPASGRYNVYLWWAPDPNRAAAAPVTISHDGGTAELTVDQRAGGCDWGLLGTYDFTAGADQSVRISGASAGYTVADAVLFEPVDGAATAGPAAGAAGAGGRR